MAKRAVAHWASCIALVLAVLAFPATAYAQVPDVTDVAGDWAYALPVVGYKLAERWMRLPLPLGIGLNDAKVRGWYDGLPVGQKVIVEKLVQRIGAHGDPELHYDLDKAIAYSWNLLIGSEIDLSDAWRLRAEFAFIQRTQLVLGFNYRFDSFSSPSSAPPPD
ncbi:MAG: hypothetical protein ABW133_23065 [Polyangiaceae bacterium]